MWKNPIVCSDDRHCMLHIISITSLEVIISIKEKLHIASYCMKQKLKRGQNWCLVFAKSLKHLISVVCKKYCMILNQFVHIRTHSGLTWLYNIFQYNFFWLCTHFWQNLKSNLNQRNWHELNYFIEPVQLPCMIPNQILCSVFFVFVKLEANNSFTLK